MVISWQNELKGSKNTPYAAQMAADCSKVALKKVLSSRFMLKDLGEEVCN